MTNLITLEQYKAIKNKVNDKDDALISATLPGISSLVRSYCNRNFTEFFDTDKTELFSFEWGQEAVFLSETPIVEVVSVEERLNSSEDYTLLEVGTDYVVDLNLDAIYRVSNGYLGKKFCRGVNCVRVVYKAGYEEVPTDLQLAIADLVTYYINDEYKTEKTNLSFTLKTPGTSSKQGDGNLPDHIKRVLDLHRNV